MGYFIHMLPEQVALLLSNRYPALHAHSNLPSSSMQI